MPGTKHVGHLAQPLSFRETLQFYSHNMHTTVSAFCTKALNDPDFPSEPDEARKHVLSSSRYTDRDMHSIIHLINSHAVNPVKMYKTFHSYVATSQSSPHLIYRDFVHTVLNDPDFPESLPTAEEYIQYLYGLPNMYPPEAFRAFLMLWEGWVSYNRRLGFEVTPAPSHLFATMESATAFRRKVPPNTEPTNSEPSTDDDPDLSIQGLAARNPEYGAKFGPGTLDLDTVVRMLGDPTVTDTDAAVAVTLLRGTDTLKYVVALMFGSRRHTKAIRE